MPPGGGSQASPPNIPARKSLFGIATRATSWLKPTVTKSTGNLIFNPRALAVFLCPRRSAFPRFELLNLSIGFPRIFQPLALLQA
jgi:hypothetical protein